ncbi:MAG: ATP-binding cassette domain-containing protein [Firmicutes bacterium]|nr:ATP-binding cassette domain-containing protein [Bacillota bacterium]
MSDEYIYRVEGVKTYFPVKSTKLFDKEKKFVRAVDGVNLDIKRGEIVGIVGESGCGKSTLGRTMLRLLEPTEGKLIFEGEDISHLDRKQMRHFRKDIQIMFQDPYASLDPRMTVGNIIAEPMDRMKTWKTKEERLKRIVELMEVCGINKAFINRYPHEFSGGQRQRIGIARALSVNPKFIVCDEPVSALDVSIQSQIINLMIELREKFDLTMMFISHDLGVVEYISDRVAIMYLGRIVEIAETEEVFKNPHHPYTKALLESIPQIGEKDLVKKDLLEGDIPSPINPPSGCTFHTRCPYAKEICSQECPQMRDLNDKHKVACHLF